MGLYLYTNETMLKISPEELTTSQAAARIAAHFRDDPEGYVDFMFPWGKKGTMLEYSDGPRKWQREILRDFGERLRSRNVEELRQAKQSISTIKYSIVSGHGSGKSALLSWITLFLFDTRPYSMGSMTATTKQQMEGKFFSQLELWLKISKLSKFGTIVAGNNPRLQRVGAENTWKLEGYSPAKERSEAFAGQHSNTSASYYIFDEASGVDDAFYDVCQGGLMDSEPFVFACGNGTKPYGFFYNSHHPTKESRESDKGWNLYSVNSLDVEGINLDNINEMIDDHGFESDFVRTRIRGLFPILGESAFFSKDIIDDCIGMEDPRDNDYAPLLIGVDVARQGDDKSVICVRKGRNVRNAMGRDTWMYFDKNSITQLASAISALCVRMAQRGTPAQRVFVEGIGVGEGLIDQLANLGVPHVVEVKTGSPKVSRAGAFNKRAEMYMNLREAMVQGLALPDSDRLHKDLSGIQFGYKDSGALYLQSKKDMKSRGQLSCDFSDALALTFCDPVFTMDTPYGLAHTRLQMHELNQLGGRSGGRGDFRDWAMKRGI